MIPADDHQQPLVSVCIPTFNRAQQMNGAVKAVLCGEYVNVEIIISDNASSDNTQAVGESLALEDSRVRYFRHPKNMGPVPNFEFARGQAHGKYFLWHGDDDYLGSDYLRVCVEALEQDPSLVLVSGLAAYHNRGAAEVDYYGNIIQPGSTSPLIRVLTYLWKVDENSIFCGVYRSDRVSHCKMPNRLAGDWMWMVCVLLQGRALVIPSIFVHRDYGDSTSVNVSRIAEVHGLPAWHARFPWTAICIHFLRHLWQSLELSQVATPKAVAFSGMVSIVLMARAVRTNIGRALKSVPVLNRLYRVVRPKLVRWAGIK